MPVMGGVAVVDSLRAADDIRAVLPPLQAPRTNHQPMPAKCALLLLPGLEGAGYLFQPLLAALPASVRPIVVEYPRTASNAYADLLPVVRAAVPTDMPVVVLGWSFGGPLAVMLGAEPPPNLRGVIIAASFVTSPQPWMRWGRGLIRAPLTPLYGLLAKAKARVWGYGTPELLTLLGQVYQTVAPVAFAARIRASLAVDVRQQLRAIKLPMLYLAARHDVVVPSYCRREIERLRPDVVVETIDGPHLALATNPTEAARRMMGFIENACRSIE